MAKKPIESFKNQEQLEEYGRDWQHKLFLDNWFITFQLTDEPLYQEGMELWGYSALNFENSSAQVVVFNGKSLTNSESKNIAELTLVHELLHLKTEYISDEEIVGKVPPLITSITHQALEMMAKSCIMAKYDVDYAYFMDNAKMPSNIVSEARRGVSR